MGVTAQYIAVSAQVAPGVIGSTQLAPSAQSAVQLLESFDESAATSRTFTAANLNANYRGYIIRMVGSWAGAASAQPAVGLNGGAEIQFQGIMANVATGNSMTEIYISNVGATKRAYYSVYNNMATGTPVMKCINDVLTANITAMILDYDAAVAATFTGNTQLFGIV